MRNLLDNAINYTPENGQVTLRLMVDRFSGVVVLIVEVVDGIEAQIHQVFRNLEAVAAAAGASLDDAAKLTVFLTDLASFARLNEIMAQYLKPPYPARSAVGVSQLPRGALVEIEAVLVKA